MVTERIRPIDLRVGHRLVMTDGNGPVTVIRLCGHPYRLAYLAERDGKPFSGSVKWTAEMEVETDPGACQKCGNLIVADCACDWRECEW